MKVAEHTILLFQLEDPAIAIGTQKKYTVWNEGEKWHITGVVQPGARPKKDIWK